MDLRDIVLNYLTDNEKGMQQLITLVSERCDDRRSGTAGRSTAVCEIQYTKSAPEWVPATGIYLQRAR